MKKNHVWIVEGFVDYGIYETWEPCASVGLSREDARREMKNEWKENYPGDKFRVRKYISE